MSIIVTPDGTCIIVHPEVGTVSARTRDEALRELARRAAGKARAA